MEPKYKVDQIVKSKLAPRIRLHIVEVISQQCPGGTQFHYACRGVVDRAGELLLRSDYVKFNEIELEDIVETPELLQLQEEREKVRAEKMVALSVRDYENAAKLRDKEREFSKKIELYENA